MLVAKGLTKRFGGVVAVDNVDFTVDRGEVVGLVGPNGAGKTTVLNVITGFSKLSNGTVHFENRDIAGAPPYALAKLGIVRTFQATSLFLRMTVFENVRIGGHLTIDSGNESEIETVLDEMDLTGYRNVKADSLPYGLQRKLEIAIALACRPKLLLLDEPAAGMNPEETQGLVQELKRITEKRVTIILVEHNMRLVANVCHRIIVLHRGQKIAEGSPADVLNLPQVVEIYLGKRSHVRN